MSGGPPAAVCCLPAPPCGELRCSDAVAAADCHALAAALAPVPPDPLLCDAAAQNLPSWEDVVAPFVYVPAVAFLLVVLLWALFRWTYIALNLRSHRLILNHIGCRDHPYPRLPLFLVAVNFGQIAASLWTLGLFVLSTYLRFVPAAARWMEVLLGVFLAFHFAVRGFQREFESAQLVRPGQVVDLLTVPSMLLLSVADESFVEVHWVSLNFLRSIAALLAYEQLEKLGAVKISAGELLHEVSSMALRFMALAVCFASSILVLETLGDLPGATPSTIPTAMGDLSFFTMVYWIVETITTVGYGDFTPKTVLSRIVTILCMVTGFAFLGLELERVFSIIARRKKGSGSYVKTPRKHVVLVGGGVQQADELLLLAFLEELFHRSYRAHWPDLVVMASDVNGMEKIREIIELQIEWQARQQIHYLVGSPLNMVDLKRCRCDVATVVFVVSDTSGKNEPRDEDKENLLRALSLKNTFPQTPLRLMLLLQESKEKAFSVGIPPHYCFAMNELKNSLFWQACRCKGWNTLLSNLMVTTETDDMDSENLNKTPWLQEYVLGMGHEVYGFLAAEEFYGASLASLTCEAYQRTGICIFAAQIDGKIEPAPLRKLKTVSAATVLFALAQDEIDLQEVSVQDEKQDWREVFAENRRKMYEQRQTLQEPGSSSGHPLSPQRSARVSLQRDLSSAEKVEPLPKNGCVFLPPPYPELPALDKLPEPDELTDRSRERGMAITRTPKPDDSLSEVQETLSASHALPSYGPQASISNAAAKPRHTLRKSTSVYSLDGATSSTQPFRAASAFGGTGSTQPFRGTSAFGGADMLPTSEVRDCERKAEVIKANFQAAPFVLLLNLSNTWGTVLPFLTQSRASYLPFELPIVVLCTVPPSRALADELSMAEDSGFGHLVGNPHWAPDLLRAGAAECCVIVALGSGPAEDATCSGGELTAMLDADVVMLQRMLHSLGVMNKAVIFEFKRTQNLRLLPTLRPSSRRIQEQRSAGAVAGVSGQSTASETSVAPRESSRDLVLVGGAPRSRSLRERCRQWLQVCRCCLSGPSSAGSGDAAAPGLSPREAAGQGAGQEPGPKKSEAEAESREAFFLNPRFAAGEIFTPHVLGALLAHVFYTPGVMEVMQAMVLPAETEDDANFPWQAHLRPQDEGRAYGEVFADLVMDQAHPVLPLGVLRCVRCDETGKGASKPYVWTNPSGDAVLRPGDLLYILGDRQFGQMLFESGRLPLSGVQRSGARPSLSWSREEAGRDLGSSTPSGPRSPQQGHRMRSINFAEPKQSLMSSNTDE